MARKKIPIDLIELEKLGAMVCTLSEVAAWFGVKRQTIDNRMADTKTKYKFGPEGIKYTFREIFEQGKGKGTVNLRRQQMQGCERGNPTMLIWMGKILLGQKDELALTGKDGKELIPSEYYDKRIRDRALAAEAMEDADEIPVRS